VGTGDLSSVGVRVNMEDSRLIAQFQRLTTELLIEKRLGRRRLELTDELYRTWLEVDQRDLKETPEYRNVMKRADRHALWLAGLVMLSTSAPLSSKETSPSSRMRRPDSRHSLAYDSRHGRSKLRPRWCMSLAQREPRPGVTEGGVSGAPSIRDLSGLRAPAR
jgi:hypothetical protein